MYKSVEATLEGKDESTHWDLLLRDDYRTVLSSNADRGDVGGCDGFEGIFCKRDF